MKLPLFYAILFLTWQKIAPLLLLLTLSSKMSLLIVLIANLFVASYRRISRKELALLLFFSSLIHLGWVVAIPLNLAIMYFSFYCIMTFPFITLTNIPILLFNIAGLPPFTGFFMKLMAIQSLSLGLTILVLFFSLLVLYAYIRIFL